MDENWEVCCSDPEDAPDYKPDPERIIYLYEKFCAGELPDLEATIHPKRAAKKPSQDSTNNENESEEKSSEEPEKKPAPSMELNEFDFDTQPEKPTKKFNKIKRAPARQQQKKVARMEKVCSDILKYQKLDEDQKAAHENQQAAKKS